ncbi:MAG TPA: GDSL-type esterase/lipase family protein [Stellaceae bacterium]|nr:GDSL-type esterase/lipase family protein [Stellaceae bacterium]
MIRSGAAVILAMLLGFSGVAAGAPERWVRSWGTALQAPDDPDDYPGADKPLPAATIRQTLRPTIAGDRITLRLSNRFGTAALDFGEVRIAVSRGKGRIDPGTDRGLTFGGKAALSIAPGGTAQCDPLDFPVKALQELAVTFYLPHGTSGVLTLHLESRHATMILPGGDRSAASDLAGASQSDFKYFLEALDVGRRDDAGVIVAFGDSITDGYKSTNEAYRSWPDRLAQHPFSAPMSVINEGISGNRVLLPVVGPAAVARFEGDALDVPGVRTIVLLEAINDIWDPDPAHPVGVGAAEIIAGYRRMIDAAHARGVRIIGGTLLPDLDPGIEGRHDETVRQEINRWLRDAKAFDAVVDFDAIFRNPADPARFRPEYDSGDHVHPNDLGYAVMADAVAAVIAAHQAGRRAGP